MTSGPTIGTLSDLEGDWGWSYHPVSVDIDEEFMESSLGSWVPPQKTEVGSFALSSLAFSVTLSPKTLERLESGECAWLLRT